MVNEEIQKATNQDRTGHLNKEETEIEIAPHPMRNLQTIIEKHWHILNINQLIFENKPLLAFRRNKNLRQMIGENTIEKK